jgi:hypothetical protein
VTFLCGELCEADSRHRERFESANQTARPNRRIGRRSCVRHGGRSDLDPTNEQANTSPAGRSAGSIGSNISGVPVPDTPV